MTEVSAFRSKASFLPPHPDPTWKTVCSGKVGEQTQIAMKLDLVAIF